MIDDEVKVDFLLSVPPGHCLDLASDGRGCEDVDCVFDLVVVGVLSTVTWRGAQHGGVVAPTQFLATSLSR